jgi:hypothetical protein
MPWPLALVIFPITVAVRCVAGLVRAISVVEVPL